MSKEKKSEHGGDIYRNHVKYDFSVNTSPYGTPPSVRAAISKSLLDIGCYPDSHYEELREAIAKSEGCEAKNIICGNGATELIFAVTRSVKQLCEKQDISVGLFTPGFLEYEKAAMAVGLSINKVELKEDKAFLPEKSDIDELVKNDFIIIGNPNNPTGRLFNKTWLESLLKKVEELGSYVMVDESFLPLTLLEEEYDELYRELLDTNSRVIRIKSYTKSMAIPGIRLGYAFCTNDELVESIYAQLPEWNVSIPAMRAGIEAAYCKEWLKEKIVENESGLEAERRYLAEGLRLAGTILGHEIKVYDSDTSFLLIKCDFNLYDYLLEKGILIRDCENFFDEDGFYRIAVKSRRENDELLFSLGVKNSHCKKADRGELLTVKPSEIEAKSFSILTEELEARGIILEGDTASVIKRCIHTSADFEYVNTLRFSDDAVSIAKGLIREGAHIVTDTNMALTGISKMELAKYGCNCHCFMADLDVASEAKERGVTRATVSMERASRRNSKTIFVVGNAPTALITLCELMDSGMYTPDFIVGVPVGFVNVEQAKDMVMERDIPYIVNRGRKGGSNVAACIINAILYQMREEDNA